MQILRIEIMLIWEQEVDFLLKHYGIFIEPVKNDDERLKKIGNYLQSANMVLLFFLLVISIFL